MDVDEEAEQVIRVVRARRRLGMVLDAEDRLVPVPEPLERAVVQVDVRHHHARGQRLGIDRESVVLRRDFHAAGLHLLHRVVRPAVTELQLERPRAQRQPQHLVAETNPEHRRPAGHDGADVVHHVRQRGGIAGTVAEEDAVGRTAEQHRRRRRRRVDADVATVGGQPSQDVPLHAEVPRRDREAARADAPGLEVVPAGPAHHARRPASRTAPRT